MDNEKKRHELTYDLIKRAVHGERAALEEILLHYDAYLNSLVTYETTGPDGRTYRHIDEDTLEMGYLNARLLCKPVTPWLTGIVE